MDSLIDEIRSKDFDCNGLDSSKLLINHFDNLNNGDFTICFNDKKLDFWSQHFSDEKMATLTRGKIYEILDTKIGDNSRSIGDKLIRIVNDNNRKIWILTGRLAFGPELAQNQMRHEKLDWVLNEDDDDPFDEPSKKKKKKKK